jgi:hypothetical protein
VILESRLSGIHQNLHLFLPLPQMISTADFQCIYGESLIPLVNHIAISTEPAPLKSLPNIRLLSEGNYSLVSNIKELKYVPQAKIKLSVCYTLVILSIFALQTIKDFGDNKIYNKIKQQNYNDRK